MSVKVFFKNIRKKTIAITCLTSMLLANMAVMTAQAGPFDGIGGWISDRANDVSNIASDAGQAIADSNAGKFIGEKTSAAGEAIGNGMSAAGDFIGGYAGTAGEWIGTNVAAAGKMIGDHAAIAKVWIGDNAKIAGSWIGESASTASDWLGVNASNACNWIVENGTIVGAWIGETASGVGVWIGENASAAGTKIGETASGAGIWVNEKVTDINSWIEENSLFAKDGIAVLGDNLSAFGIEKKEDAEELAIGIKEYVENIDPSVYTTKEYYIQTGEKLLLGEYSDASMTGLAVGLNVIASVVNLDMAMDLRDLAHDIQYIGDGSVGIVELGIDAASCLPVIGVVKNVKYLDDIKDVAKAVDRITDVADGVKDASKVADVIDDVKEISLAAEVVDGAKDASRIADAADDVKDAAKAAEIVDDVKDASTVAEVADDVKDASKVVDAADDVKDASNVMDAADDDTLDERVGYYGEQVVLLAQRLGLNTCWAGTFNAKNVQAEIRPGERLAIVIAIGYGKDSGRPHKSKKFDDVTAGPAEKPDWFRKGVELALLAPTAINQQKFEIRLNEDGTVTFTDRKGVFSKVNLGIVEYHFEVGSGRKCMNES